MEELRAKVSRQSDRYNDLWLIHEAMLEEAQKLRSEVITLRSVVRIGGNRGRLRVENKSPKGPVSRPGVSGRQFGRSSDRAEGSGSWHERALRGWTYQGGVHKRDRRG